MPHIVEIPGHGEVEFPDNMNDEQISNVISHQFGQISPSLSEQFAQIKQDPIGEFNRAFERTGLPQAAGGFVQGISNIPLALLNLPSEFWSNFTQQSLPKIPYFNNVAPSKMQQAGKALGEVTFPVPESSIGNLSAEGINNLVRGFAPSVTANEIKQNITGGLTHDQNAAKLGNDIYRLGKSAFTAANKGYTDLLNRAGNTEIDILPELPKGITPHLSGQAERAEAAYLENPNFNTAHNYQKALNKNAYELMRSKDPTLRQLGEKLSYSHDKFLQEIKKRLQPNEAQEYENLNNFWRDEVSHYLYDPVFGKIITGKKYKPENLPNYFKNVYQTGIGSSENSPQTLKTIEKVASDLGTSLNRAVVHHELPKNVQDLSPEELLNALKKVSSSSGIKYPTESLPEQMAQLENAIKNKETALFIPQTIKNLINSKLAGGAIGGIATGLGLNEYMKHRNKHGVIT